LEQFGKNDRFYRCRWGDIHFLVCWKILPCERMKPLSEWLGERGSFNYVWYILRTRIHLWSSGS
jgi:hypothetical protein